MKNVIFFQRRIHRYTVQTNISGRIKQGGRFHRMYSLSAEVDRYLEGAICQRDVANQSEQFPSKHSGDLCGPRSNELPHL